MFGATLNLHGLHVSNYVVPVIFGKLKDGS